MTVLRREVTLSRIASQRGALSHSSHACPPSRACLHPSSLVPEDPALDRSCQFAAGVLMGYSTAQMNPTSSRATATTAFGAGTRAEVIRE
jgi:hypothetical protein